jgi:hypothetical protein
MNDPCFLLPLLSSPLLSLFLIRFSSFSEVYLGSWRGTDVAIKKVYTTSPAHTYSSSSFQKEINLISQLRHPKGNKQGKERKERKEQPEKEEMRILKI